MGHNTTGPPCNVGCPTAMHQGAGQACSVPTTITDAASKTTLAC